MRQTLFLPFLFFAMLFSACDQQATKIASKQMTPPKRIGLPNGWSLTPVGEHLPLGDLPLQILLTADGKRAIATNNGQSAHSLTVVDLESKKVLQELSIPKAWYGLAWHPGEKTLYASGGYDNCIRIYDFNGSSLTYRDSIALARPWPNDNISPAGIAVDAEPAIEPGDRRDRTGPGAGGRLVQHTSDGRRTSRGDPARTRLTG